MLHLLILNDLDQMLHWGAFTCAVIKPNSVTVHITIRRPREAERDVQAVQSCANVPLMTTR